jgi:hypothetical protein
MRSRSAGNKTILDAGENLRGACSQHAKRHVWIGESGRTIREQRPRIDIDRLRAKRSSHFSL